MKNFVNKLKTNKKFRIVFIVIMILISSFAIWLLLFKKSGNTGGGADDSYLYGTQYAGNGVSYSPGISDSSGADTAALVGVMQDYQKDLSQALSDMFSSNYAFQQESLKSQSESFKSISDSINEQNKGLLEMLKDFTGKNPTNEYLNNQGNNSGNYGSTGNSGTTKNYGLDFDNFLSLITGYKNQWNSYNANKNTAGMQSAKASADAVRQQAIQAAQSAGFNYQWYDTGQGTKQLRVTGDGKTWQL